MLVLVLRHKSVFVLPVCAQDHAPVIHWTPKNVDMEEVCVKHSFA